jgi:hypothetical protein
LNNLKKHLRNLSFLILSAFLILTIAGCASQMGKGSEKSLYTVSETLEVNRSDLGKSIQLKLDQKLFFNFDSNPEEPGYWELVQYNNRNLIILSETPRVAEGHWGVLMQARGLGFTDVELKFIPLDESHPSQNHNFSISITR